MVGDKTLLVFLLAALAQSCAGEPVPEGQAISLGEPFTSLVNSLGLGASLAHALRAQCDCGACDDVDPPGWLALVLRYGFASCGGALITDRHALTSAHCVKGLEAAEVAVLLGAAGPRSQALRDKPEAQPGEQLRVALRIARRSKVAVITLDAPVTFTKKIAPICLPEPANKARKLERVEVHGMSLTDPKTLALTALENSGVVTRVDGREVSFASDDGVCLAFEGWPLVRKNATSSKCELIGIQSEVTSPKTTSTKAPSSESFEDSSEETTLPATTTASTTTTPVPECFDQSEFASVAHYLSWIREQTADATQCAPPTAPKDEQRQRQRWRSNLRSAARAAKRRASDQAKLKAAKKAAEKKANKKTREKRSPANVKTRKAKERTAEARMKWEKKAYDRLQGTMKYEARRTPEMSLTSGRAVGLSLRGKTMAAKKSALARRVIGSKISMAGKQADDSPMAFAGRAAFPEADSPMKFGSEASEELPFHAKVWDKQSKAER